MSDIPKHLAQMQRMSSHTRTNLDNGAPALDECGQYVKMRLQVLAVTGNRLADKRLVWHVLEDSVTHFGDLAVGAAAAWLQ